MKCRSTPRAQGQRGSVVVEFLGLGILLGIPLVYLMVTLSSFERASLAAVSVAEEASRIQASAPNAATAEQWRRVAVRDIAKGHGLDPNTVTMNVSCSGGCPGPGARVSVKASISVPLPLIPSAGVRVGTVSSTSVSLSPRYG